MFLNIFPSIQSLHFIKFADCCAKSPDFVPVPIIYKEYKNNFGTEYSGGYEVGRLRTATVTDLCGVTSVIYPFGRNENIIDVF